MQKNRDSFAGISVRLKKPAEAARKPNSVSETGYPDSDDDHSSWAAVA